MGEKHPANSEIIVKRNEIDSLVERVHALDVEADTEPVRGSGILDIGGGADEAIFVAMGGNARLDEHTSELQSLKRMSYAVFCLKTDTISQLAFSLIILTSAHYLHISTCCN